MTRLPQFDDRIMGMANEAAAKGEKLTYAGKIHADGTVSVAIQSVAQSHPPSSLKWYR